MRVDNLTVNVISTLANTNGVGILFAIILRCNIRIFDFVYHKVKIRSTNGRFIDSSIWKICIQVAHFVRIFGEMF